MTKKKWDAELNRGWRKKIYLEGECFAWLKKCLEYGTEARARKRAEPPVVTIRSKTQADGMEILLCQAHGFYPREIDASWRRDGEVWLEDTLQESVAPNSDGTYHYQLSVRIDPKERDRYRCHVEHDGLQEPLDVAMEEAASTAVYFRMGGMGISFLLLVVLYGYIGYWTKKKEEEEEEGGGGRGGGGGEGEEEEESTTSDDVLESVMNYR